MPVAVNHAKKKLEAGGLVLGLGIRQFRTVEIGLIARAAGFDFIFLDQEHGTMDLTTAAEISVAALGQGITPIVRVASHEAQAVAPLLDSGTQGIAFPHVESVDDARRIVAIQKFPPLGARSISRTTAWNGFEAMPIDALTRDVNDNTLTIVMLESAGAIACADEIAALEGVDVLLIGTSDLCIDLGIPGAFGDQKVADAYRRVVDACRRHGKFAGMSGVREIEFSRRYIEMGARFVLVTSDVPLLLEAGKARTKVFRELESGLAATKR
jgi:4-hydroxy-2-oxoheptanedioate aldolase